MDFLVFFMIRISRFKASFSTFDPGKYGHLKNCYTFAPEISKGCLIQIKESKKAEIIPNEPGRVMPPRETETLNLFRIVCTPISASIFWEEFEIGFFIFKTIVQPKDNCPFYP